MKIHALLEPEKKFEAGYNKEYELEVIINSVIYSHKAENQLPSLYYLVLSKRYPEEKNIEETLAAITYLQKLISTFYTEYPNKPTEISLFLYSIISMVSPTVPIE